MGWGPNMLTVEAKTDERAAEIATQLATLGFKVIQNDDNAEAGILDLSKNPAAIQTQIASLDISHRRWYEQILPLIFAFGSLLMVRGIGGPHSRTPYWVDLAIGLVCLPLFFWEAARIWGWKLELLPEGIHIRQYFRWATIPWDQIHSVQTVPAKLSSRQETVILKLTDQALPHAPHLAPTRLGTFGYPFARILRDRLQIELARRHGFTAQHDS